MGFLLITLRFVLIPAAAARALENLGRSDPGVAGMWAVVVNVFPHARDGWGANLIINLSLKVIIFFLTTIVAVAAGMLIYAGIVMTTSGGDSAKLEETKKIAINVGIGLILSMLADGIALYVLNLVRAAA